MIAHNASCGIWRDPPGLRSEWNCNCGAIQQTSYDDLRKQRDAFMGEVLELRPRVSEAERLLRAAYANTHPEEVPIEVLRWLNPEENV